jgi:hypothetical protein
MTSPRQQLCTDRAHLAMAKRGRRMAHPSRPGRGWAFPSPRPAARQRCAGGTSLMTTRKHKRTPRSASAARRSADLWRTVDQLGARISHRSAVVRDSPGSVRAHSVIAAIRPNMLSQHCWCTHLREMLAHERTDRAVGFDREHNVVKEHGSRIQAPDRPCNGLAREVFWRMRRWRLWGEVAPNVR